MAKKKSAKPETKSEFLRKVLSKNPDLEYEQVLRRWAESGHAGTISNALYYQVRVKLGIRTVWTWGPADRLEPQAPARGGATGQVFQFKITLLETQPQIWRRIQVVDGTLDKLHEHIQTAMGWTNSHLNHFRIDGTLYGDPLLMEETFEELEYKDSTTTMLSEILPEGTRRTSFEYEYDFGDGWLHEVRLEGRMQAEPGKHYPLCLDGARACPPEDVGGVWGYAEFVEAMADRKHPRHDELLEWVGGKFDPDAFNPTVATRRMKKGLPDWRRDLY